jgi:formyltetrahydrofolate deformylase
MSPRRLVLTIKCPDRIGIVAAVATRLTDLQCNIEESQQFGDPGAHTFFMRIAFDTPATNSVEDIRAELAPIAERFEMSWTLSDVAVLPRVMLLSSKLDHCLVDLLYRWRIGALPMEITSIASNHAELAEHAARAGVPFHHLPITRETKLEQETELARLIKAENVSLVVLARYMQILSDGLAAKLSGRCINIHHSFLPSFKGAGPYTQAYKRGVKLIGATAHYVTADLDEGPIIEQETERVDHAMSVDQFTGIGREIEARVLARAVRYHLEHRVLINGHKTVVFR